MKNFIPYEKGKASENFFPIVVVGVVVVMLVIATAIFITSNEQLPNDEISILSKSDLTDTTSIYLMNINGTKFVVVNGVNKVAVKKYY